jgi:coenzyme F420-reducing hydrogenase alpha subunit
MEIARKTLDAFKRDVDRFTDEIEAFGSAPLMSAALVDRDGNLQLYDGLLRFQGADGRVVADGILPEEYAAWIGETSLRDSYMKAPHFKPSVTVSRRSARAHERDPRVWDRARRCGAAEFRDRFGMPAHGAFLYHYARLIEILRARAHRAPPRRSAHPRPARAHDGRRQRE